MHKKWILGLVGLATVCGLPLVGNWVRHTSEPRCALDRSKLDPAFQVRVWDQQGREHDFCCIRCAVSWIEHQPSKPAAIHVVDEASGQELDARTAYYVRSLVITQPTTGNRIHVFRNRVDAEKHAILSRGTLLSDTERPFPSGS